uniref:RING-type domain-containing protein n=1 Tax=Oreochromis aureus TaxID=47969 RepID=A0A668V0V2_OREAU
LKSKVFYCVVLFHLKSMNTRNRNRKRLSILLSLSFSFFLPFTYLFSSMSPHWHCPVCLQTARFPVQTNCGHLFCAPCLITYWRHGSWLDAISCPLCRQKVSVLCHLFNETRSDQQSKEVLGEITAYNKRYSGAPRRVTDYLCDTPLLLQLLVRGLGTMGGLVWLFLFRVALCCVGTVMSISSPALDAVSSSSTLETDPSLCGLLGVLDDLVVVILLLICVININQQITPERHPGNATTSQGVMGDSL